MLFQNPQLLWGLSLLLIPVLVHLLRLRRYRKTEFTNVRVLQRLLAESNKSSQLKKWLLLLARLGLIAALVLAFSQPYRAEPGAGQAREIVLYIDNSFSMQAPEGNRTALQEAVQSVLQHLPEDAEIGLLTNTENYRIQPMQNLRERLLNLEYVPQPLTAATLSIRAGGTFGKDAGTLREFWLISDFEDMDLRELDTLETGSLHAVKIPSEAPANMAVDTAFIRSQGPELLELEVAVSLWNGADPVPLSLYDGDTLIAKSAPDITDTGTGQAIFSLPSGEEIEGSIRIMDKGLNYDDVLYFNLQNPPRIRVYGIGEASPDFLSRIYTPDEFDFVYTSPAKLDFSLLPDQDLILLNEPGEISPSLQRELLRFLQEGGTVILIPRATYDAESVNRFLTSASAPTLGKAVSGEMRITGIQTGHPVFRDVFEGEVTDFDFPKVAGYFVLGSGGTSLLSYQNGDSFLKASGNLYVFSAPLNVGNSNFQNSPLVVPTFYNIGRQSLPVPKLYYTIGRENQVDVEVTLEEDQILRMESPSYSFVPRQQGFARKTRLTFLEEPVEGGRYTLLSGENPLGVFSFNYPRTEGQNVAEPIEWPDWIQTYEDTKTLIGRYQNDTRIHALWKWFVILALLFAAAELILQKTIR